MLSDLLKVNQDIFVKSSKHVETCLVSANDNFVMSNAFNIKSNFLDVIPPNVLFASAGPAY